MTSPPLNAGDFVRCRFPEREHPATPSAHLHIAYVILVTALPRPAATGPVEPAFQAVVAYTTSRPWPASGQRPGVIAFNAEQAEALGQKRPFWLHLWRLAHLPVTQAWFPRPSVAGGCGAGQSRSGAASAAGSRHG